MLELRNGRKDVKVDKILPVLAAKGWKPQDIADMSLCKKLDDTGFFERLHQPG